MPSNNANRQQQQQREVEAMPSFVNQHFTGEYFKYFFNQIKYKYIYDVIINFLSNCP